MSWQKCVSAESYSLAVPAVVVAALDFLHLWVCLSLFWLIIPPDLTVLLLVWVMRSWKEMHRRLEQAAQLELRVGRNGEFYVNERSRRRLGKNAGDNASVDDDSEYYFNAAKMNDVLESVVTQRQDMGDTGALQQYTCCRSVKVPGCILLTLVNGGAKPLEILVFYRYYQRGFYRWLLRHIALQ